MDRAPSAQLDSSIVDGVFAAASLTPYVIVELDSLHNVIETVRRGLGVGAMVAGTIQADLEVARYKRASARTDPTDAPDVPGPSPLASVIASCAVVYEALLEIAGETPSTTPVKKAAH